MVRADLDGWDAHAECGEGYRGSFRKVGSPDPSLTLTLTLALALALALTLTLAPTLALTLALTLPRSSCAPTAVTPGSPSPIEGLPLSG